MNFYVLWLEKSPEGQNTRNWVACFDESDADQKVKDFKKLKYIFGAIKVRGDELIGDQT